VLLGAEIDSIPVGLGSWFAAPMTSLALKRKDKIGFVLPKMQNYYNSTLKIYDLSSEPCGTFHLGDRCPQS
jgi:hypothetical protein